MRINPNATPEKIMEGKKRELRLRLKEEKEAYNKLNKQQKEMVDEVLKGYEYPEYRITDAIEIVKGNLEDKNKSGLYHFLINRALRKKAAMEGKYNVPSTVDLNTIVDETEVFFDFDHCLKKAEETLKNEIKERRNIVFDTIIKDKTIADYLFKYDLDDYLILIKKVDKEFVDAFIDESINMLNNIKSFITKFSERDLEDLEEVLSRFEIVKTRINKSSSEIIEELLK